MGNWFTEIFTGGISKAADSIGNAIDKCVTSDEERLTIKASVSESLNKLSNIVEENVTKRWESDNNSDSKLTKRVRPISFLSVLYFLMIMTVVSCFWVVDLGTEQLITEWMGLWKAILQVMVGGYFGSRGIEKAVQIWANRGK